MNVVTNDKGRPVAVTASLKKARQYVYRRLHLEYTHHIRWTDTGKLMLDNRWTGWEVKEVASI